MIKVSVIIPVYNAEKYLKQCLDSVLSQKLKEIQVICIDDGSVDGSYDILKNYALKYKNVKILQQANKGAGTARNQGIKCAEGEYVCFLDADDYYYDNSVLDQLYHAAINHKVLICGGNIVRFADNILGEKLAPVFEQEKCLLYKEFQDFYYYQRFIFHKKMLLDNQIVFPVYRRFQDPPFMLRAMLAADKLYALDYPVYVYRTGHKNIRTSLNIATEILEGIKECFEIARENNLTILYDIRLKKIMDVTFPYYVKFIYEHEEKICGLLAQINEINRQWLDAQATELMTEEKVLEEIEEALQLRNELLEKCHSYERVIVYGAGKFGGFFLENYAHECKNIIGIAVTSKGDNEDRIGEYQVRNIEEYAYYADKEDCLVVVAIGKKHSKEVVDKLKGLDFKNCVCVDFAKLSRMKQGGII